MKDVTKKVFDYFKKSKQVRIGAIGLVLGLIVFGVLFYSSDSLKEEVIPLSQVATEVSAGHVLKIEDAQEKGLVTIHYEDGSQKTTRRDPNSSVLEQLKLLGVSETQLAK